MLITVRQVRKASFDFARPFEHLSGGPSEGEHKTKGPDGKYDDDRHDHINLHHPKIDSLETENHSNVRLRQLGKQSSCIVEACA